MTPPDYEYLRKLLRDQSGLDLSTDKQYLIESRLLPLARKAGLPGISDLVQKMKGGSNALITQVVEAMTTWVMRAFDPPFIFCTRSPMPGRPALRASGNRRLSIRYCLSVDRSRPDWSRSSLRRYS